MASAASLIPFSGKGIVKVYACPEEKEIRTVKEMVTHSTVGH